ncbi:ABC transporter substrate-binding protein [Amycolatopsis alkalitolerans]|uniref:ABC transporter substrate-binding protein n=1 Tax=Amycolatopsis alkalitolerans TaxID=2547244 RepID=A0A5C4M1K7_9PSEU|nr:ABC transporter substrate-binding protein [Amycolatopsis alkalitolerans]TNC23598.1 ABC transporter substrate-binding protein [Amycolatopsis alkalitolerans]
MRIRIHQLLALAAVTFLVAACGGGQAASTTPAGPPKRGGTLTVLELSSFAGVWPSGLDPATNTTGAANLSLMTAIFGGLFRLSANDDGSNAHVEPDLAGGYDVSPDAKTVRITIRDGVKFSDGTPFDAEAVAFNFTRDVKSTCTCAPKWPLAPDGISTEGNTVVLKFTRPYAPVINAMLVSNANWIASPTALRQLGPDRFKVTPVGAGPFKVENDVLSSELRLTRNESYYHQGRPYLDKLIFKSIGGDQAAYQAVQAGQAQAYEGMVTTPLIQQAENDKRVTLTLQPANSPYVIQFNTKIPPLNDQRAREAIYYATDVEAIRKGLFRDLSPASQTFTAPGGLFYHPTVPGYRTFDLAKAKALVSQLGGLSVDLGTLKSYVAEQVITALKSQWEAAGIHVTMHSDELNAQIQQYNSGKWQIQLATSGAWDPAAGTGVGFRFLSGRPFSGVDDPQLDSLLNQAEAVTDPARRDALYQQAGKLMSDKAYAPFLLAGPRGNLAAPGVYGPGLTTKIPPLVVNNGIHWDSVWRSS